ncbi:metallophosphoesterase [Streptomyces sp. NPDC056549]|uniref:metallophosphoesterase n=1 Tax=Streptomyces sp. NPDC056549 TaxID=3345864 RepID=UPI0036CD8B3D
MCGDDAIPEKADLTETQWARSLGLPSRHTGRPALRRRTLLASMVAGATLAALPGRATADPALADGPGKFPLPAGVGRDGALSVLITGDAGTGEAAQYAVAAAARQICAAEDVRLAVGLGDNIYENGPESDHDSEFATKFEQPNTGIDVPWLMVLGNHDCSGIIPGSGGDPSRGDREVDYAATSPRWYMPSRYYSVTVPAVPGGTTPLVEFFALDTNPVASTVTQTDPYYKWDGPYMREQRRWLDDALSRSQESWKVVLGHHPYLNNGQHGNAGRYDGFLVGHYTRGIHLKELYEEVVCGRADLILSGHDHTLQVLEPTTASRGTRQIVCGAAGKTGDGRAHGSTPARWQDFSQHGFMIAKVTEERVTLNAYTVDVNTARATLAHTSSIRPLQVAAA